MRFFDHEAMGGLMLIATALLALLLANSPAASSYFSVTHAHLGAVTLHLFVNDALMALFFLLVGLEIKREFLAGRDGRALPLVAAVGGMIVPALLYLGIVGFGSGLARGWAIPAATDIAFALAVLRIAGSGLPSSLKTLLTGIAIADDIGAIAIIALAYTSHLDIGALALAGLILIAMVGLNLLGVRRLWPFLLLGLLLWVAIFVSGVHATIAGVLTALTIAGGSEEDSPLGRLEHALNRPVAFLIVPLFGFLNAGVSLQGAGREMMADPVPLAIAAGLFLGKQAGVFGSVWLVVRSGLAARPEASWAQLYGLSLLCGIGFTMSLFIGGLAFGDPQHLDAVKIGVLGGSLLSALGGLAVLRLSRRSG